MPYIKKKDRKWVDVAVDYFILHVIGVGHYTGKLNYFLFKLAKLECNNYSDYRDFIGELECAKAEIERRLLAPYEDKKIKENGDVE